MKKQALDSTSPDIADICLRTIINVSAAPVFFLDRNYRYLNFNRTHASVMKKLYGAKIKRGYSLLDYITVEQDRITAKNNFDRVLEQGKQFAVKSYSGDIKHSRRYFEVMHSPLKDSKGHIFGIAVTARDITEHKKSEEALAAGRTRYRELFNHISSGVAVYEAIKNGRDFIIRDFNRAACKIDKVKTSDIIGRSVFEVFPGIKDFGLLKVFQRVWKTGRAEHFSVAQYRDKRISGWRNNYVYKLPSGEIVAVYDDVTVQRKMLEELEVTYSRLQLALEGADLGFYDVNLSDRTFYGDHRYFELIGYSEEELEMTVDTWKKLVHPDDIEKVYDNLLKHVANRDTGRLEDEYRMHHKQGHWVWILDRARIVEWDKEENAVRLAGTHLDITERRRAEDALKESELAYRKTFETAPVGIFKSSTDDKLLMANPAMASMLGYNDINEFITEVNKNGISNTVYETPSLRSKIVQQVIDKTGWPQFEARLKRKDGAVIICLLSMRIIHSRDGSPDHLEGFIQDITERKQYQSSIERQREEYRTIFDAVPAYISYMDGSGKFLRVNQPAASSIGLTPKELIGKTYFDVFSADEAASFLSINMEVLQSGRPVFGAILKYTNPKAETHWGQNDVFPYYDHDGKIIGTILFGQDITERMKAERGLELSYEALRKSMEGAVNAMAKIVEMKDPYTAGHQARVAELAVSIARELMIPEDSINFIQTAARLHDIGKIYVPSDILSKPGNLTRIEFEIIKTHAQGSYDILKSIEFPGPVAKIALQHHERLNGTGYPHGITGEKIIEEARILAVADVVEAMVSYRPYRPSLGIDKALEEIERGKAILYDAQAVDACITLFRQKNFTFETSRSF